CLSEGLKAIGTSAFSGCQDLKTVTLLSPVRHMGNSLFDECLHLESVTLPEGMDNIPDSMFCKCESLKEIYFPSTLKQIGRKSFSDCKTLRKLVIPDSVTDIFFNTFSGCENLNLVTIAGITFPMQGLADYDKRFHDIGDAVLYVHIVVASWKKIAGPDAENLCHLVWAYMMVYYLVSQVVSQPEQALSDYLHQHFEPMFQSLISFKDTELIEKYLKQEEFFTEENIQKFILFANEKQAYEIQVMFSEYQSKHFALKSIAETIQNKFEL
ncbi:MAG: leucine-rich repeat domain-containing protein, partial [Oscillospiraceae bacterium]|nr:leucine-rich repeat domain-containing protein [Oscillospiraceae bacterium]